METIQDTGIIVRKSNSFVTAKFRTTIMGNKIIALSLAKLEEKDGQLQAILYPSEIRRLLGAQNDTNLYRRLKSVAQTLAGHVITIEDGKGNFEVFNMITNVSYKDHRMVITYNRMMTEQMSRLKSNYTSYELATLVGFSKNYTYRLYEILKKEAWRLKETIAPYVEKEYGLNELRCMIGLVNTDAPYISKAVQAGASWDRIVEEIAKREDIQYDNFGDFKSRVLNVAQQEMQEKSDIAFDYELIKGGTGGRVRAILFYIRNNIVSDEVALQIRQAQEAIEEAAPEYAELSRSVEEAEKLSCYEAVKEYLRAKGIRTANFSQATFFQIYKASGENIAVIREEIDYSIGVPNIKNYFGWLTAAVKERYSQNKPVQTIFGDCDRAERVEDVKSMVVSDEVKEKIWNRYKTESPEFDEFIDSFEFPDICAVEMMFSLDERIRMFIDFKKGRK